MISLTGNILCFICNNAAFFSFFDQLVGADSYLTHTLIAFQLNFNQMLIKTNNFKRWCDGFLVIVLSSIYQERVKITNDDALRFWFRLLSVSLFGTRLNTFLANPEKPKKKNNIGDQ